MPEKTPKIKKTVKSEKTAFVGQEGPYFEAVGRRKTAVARVRIFNHQGDFTVNGRNYQQYFPILRWRETAMGPLVKTNLTAKLAVTAKVSGGGPNAQAEAVRHGLARALLLFDRKLKTTLKSFGYLKRDSRMVERKKYGLKKARRAPQWAKR